MLTPLLFFLLSLRHTLSSAAARSVATSAGQDEELQFAAAPLRWPALSVPAACFVATSAGLDEELRYRAVPPAMTSSAPARPLRRPSPFAAGWDKLRCCAPTPQRHSAGSLSRRQTLRHEGPGDMNRP